MTGLKKTSCFFLFILCVALSAGCGKNEVKPQEMSSDADGSGNPADVPQTVTFDGTQDEGDDKVPDIILKKEDADSLISEELSGSGCKTEYSDIVRIDGNGYYTYTVKDPDGKAMDIMLAVDGFSGDVKIYDPAGKNVSDFAEFPYYDKTERRFRDINWDGLFVKGDNSIEFLPADDASVEFTVCEKDEPVLEGIASIEKDKAVWRSQDEKETIEFEMTGEDTLKVTESPDEDLKISGDYKRK